MPRSIREIALVLVLVGAGLVIMFSSDDERQAGPLSRVAYALLRPFQQAISFVHSQTAEVWRGYVDLVGVRAENRQLKAEIESLRRQRAILLGKETENLRLRKLLDLKDRYEFPSLVAQVIGEDAVGWYRTFLINRGSEDGVLPGMAATVAEGVVGRVVRTSSSVSRVRLITDPNLSVDCRLARTRDRGVLNGYLDRECIIRYVDLKAQIREGDEVVTSGLDGVFPKELPVGKVSRVRSDPQGLFLEALVTPSANFAEIEEVLVILGKRSGFDIRPGLEDGS
jgi:rod shape-determining protein MreC